MRGRGRAGVRCSVFLEQGGARGLGRSLRDGAGDLLPAAPEETLEGGVEVHLELREGGVDLVLVRGEEGAELRLVEPCGPGRLRECEVEQEDGLEEVVEGQPEVWADMYI